MDDLVKSAPDLSLPASLAPRSDCGMDDVTPDADAIWRADLTANLAAWKAQWRGKDFERRSKEASLAIAQAGNLRAGKYTRVRDQNGNLIDYNLAAANSLMNDLAQLEISQEVLETSIATAEAELAAIEGVERAE